MSDGNGCVKESPQALRVVCVGDVCGRWKALLKRLNAITQSGTHFDLCLCVGSFFSRRTNPTITAGDDGGEGRPQSRTKNGTHVNPGDEPDECNVDEYAQSRPKKRVKVTADPSDQHPHGITDENGGPNPDEKCWRDIVAGRLKVPMPIYVLGPNHSTEMPHYEFEGLKNGYELAENVLYLGQQGLFQTQEGLRVAYISGFDELLEWNQDKREELRRQIQFDKPDFQGVDILITSQWPKGVLRRSFSDEDKLQVLGAPEISSIVLSLRPRYHFAALHGHFIERPPYRYTSNQFSVTSVRKQVTRFIALAKVGNPEKKKWIYAFQLVPATHMSPSTFNNEPPDTTDLPFKRMDVMENLEIEKSIGWDSVRFGKKAVNESSKERGSDGTHRSKGSQNKSQRAIPRGPCWFCLAGTEVEKHLIVSVGEYSYLAMPKGALCANHVLILPISHFASTLEAPEEVKKELVQFKESLMASAKAQGQDVVFFERNFKSQHLQIQAVFVPSLKQIEFEEILTSTCKPYKIDLVALPFEVSLETEFEPGNLFFAINRNCEELHYVSIKTPTFPLQLGREIVANILQCPNKVNWKECALNRDEESQLVQSFRSTFAKQDFTLK